MQELTGYVTRGTVEGMALSNAEKQKRWRDRRNALAKRAARLPEPPPLPEGATHVCSYCGKPNTEADHMITGPNGVAICGECVAQCVEILEEQKRGGSA